MCPPNPGRAVAHRRLVRADTRVGPYRCPTWVGPYGCRTRVGPYGRPAWHQPDPCPAAIVVFAVAVSAVDANRPSVGIRRDNGVHPVGLAGPAEILDRFAGAVTS